MVERIVHSRTYHRDVNINDNFQQLGHESDINEEHVASGIKTEANLDGPKTQSVKTVNVGDGSKVKILTINMFMRPIVNTNGSDHKEGRLKSFADLYLS